jgi:hypothetical protein
VCALASHLEGNIVGGGVLELDSYSKVSKSAKFLQVLREKKVPGALEQCCIAMELCNSVKWENKTLARSTQMIEILG